MKRAHSLAYGLCCRSGILHTTAFSSCKGIHQRALAANHVLGCVSSISTQAGSARSSLHWRLLAAALAGVSVAGASLLDQSPLSRGLPSLMGQAHCQQQQQPAPATSTSEADKLLRLKEWLVKQGANVDLVDIRASTAGPDAGLGLFVSDKADTRKLGACSQGIRRWWWPFGGRQPSPSQRAGALAEFPLSMAVSSSNILRDPAQGAGYSWMLKHGVVDERTIVMAYLVLERLKGQASAIAPWIDALPASFHTPLHMSADELDELKGTTLYWVASKLRERLADQWEKLGPALNSLAAGAAGVSRQASLQDLQWAFSVFWSRGQSLPVPREGAASHLFAKDPKAAAQQLEVTEGILPGLDFANHQVLHPQCWWEVVVQPAASQQKQGGPPATTAALDPERVLVQLRLHAGARASRGEELFISYGDKSNEELMLLYGFAVPRNPHDLVMVKLPIPPPATWDDVMNARMELMQAEGLKPQFFLKASDLPPEAGSRQQAAAQRTAGGVATRRSVVPEEALAVLTLTVLNFSELAQRMRVLKQRQKGEAGEDTGGTVPGLDVVAMDMAELRRLKASLSTRQLSEQGHSLGLHMAALSTLVKLLEATVYELEGEEGSGPLEEDEALLERHFRQQTAGGSGPDALSPARLACIIYRSEQKRISRRYLVLVRGELAEVLSTITEVEEELRARSRAAASQAAAASK